MLENLYAREKIRELEREIEAVRLRHAVGRGGGTLPANGAWVLLRTPRLGRMFGRNAGPALGRVLESRGTR